MSLPTPCRGVTTEFAVGSDGAIYINAEGHDPRTLVGQQIFFGFALTRREVERIGPHGIHAWAAITLIAWGSDGRVYVNEEALARTSRRKLFRGFAVGAFQAACITCTLHMAAESIILDAYDMVRERGRAA